MRISLLHQKGVLSRRQFFEYPSFKYSTGEYYRKNRGKGRVEYYGKDFAASSLWAILRNPDFSSSVPENQMSDALNGLGLKSFGGGIELSNNEEFLLGIAETGGDRFDAMRMLYLPRDPKKIVVSEFTVEERAADSYAATFILEDFSPEEIGIFSKRSKLAEWIDSARS